VLTTETKKDLRTLFEQFQSASASAKTIVGERNKLKAINKNWIESTYDVQINATMR
jgi:hypothetical protein